MTIFYPDISSFQAGISMKGTVAVCCKVTESTNYFNSDYSRAKGNAQTNGAFFFAYHFLHHGDAIGQARWCHQHTGTVPLMLDVEPTVQSSPTLADVATFIAEYRRLGGVIHLVYLPHWYWQQLGSPKLDLFADFGLHLVSSQYTSYADHGPGWSPYGGVTPKVWQYTDAFRFNGHTVDFNAFKGTLAEFKSIARTGKLPAPAPPSHAVNPVENLWANARYTQADVGWNKAAGATSYRVIVKKGWKTVSTQEVKSDPPNKLTLTSLEENTNYTVTVLALPAKLKDSIAGRARVTFRTN